MRFELWIKMKDGSEHMQLDGNNKWSLFDVGYDIIKNNPDASEAWVNDLQKQERIDIDNE
jgi:hypothetical protein